MREKRIILKLENVVPWGRNLREYKQMFLLSNQDLKSKILGCGDGPSSFNYEVTKLGGDVISIDPIYQFSKDEISKRIDKTSSLISQQVRKNGDNFVWKDIKNVDELIDIRLKAMKDFLSDFDKGKNEQRYLHQELPKLSFKDKSFDIVLSSHFLFLYSDHFDLNFHIDSILEMCRVAKKEVRVFPIFDLENNHSCHLDGVIDVLDQKDFKSDIIKTDYEFQKGVNKMLKILV